MRGHFHVGVAHHALNRFHIHAQGLELRNIGVAAAMGRQHTDTGHLNISCAFPPFPRRLAVLLPQCGFFYVLVSPGSCIVPFGNGWQPFPEIFPYQTADVGMVEPCCICGFIQTFPFVPQHHAYFTTVSYFALLFISHWEAGDGIPSRSPASCPGWQTILLR